MNEELVKLLNEYKETERCMEMGMNWLNEKEYAKGKLDIVKTIIANIERLSQKV